MAKSPSTIGTWGRCSPRRPRGRTRRNHAIRRRIGSRGYGADARCGRDLAKILDRGSGTSRDDRVADACGGIHLDITETGSRREPVITRGRWVIVDDESVRTVIKAAARDSSRRP